VTSLRLTFCSDQPLFQAETAEIPTLAVCQQNIRRLGMEVMYKVRVGLLLYVLSLTCIRRSYLENIGLSLSHPK
jgi:hypothetical protein